MKKNFLFLFYLLAGILVGSLIASVCAGVPFLSWLGRHALVIYVVHQPVIYGISWLVTMILSSVS